MEQKLSQQLQLNAKMEQSLLILQMDQQELLQYLRAMAAENPVLDLEEPPAPGTACAGHRRTQGPGQGSPAEYWGDTGQSLEEHLLAQLADLDWPGRENRENRVPSMLQAAAYLIGCLDDRGYLCAPLEELATALYPPDLLQKALALVQSLEPAGVGAQDLGECILLQLGRAGGVTPPLQRLVDCHLEQLARGSIRAISDALGVSMDQVREMAQRIRGTNPKPGAGLDRPRYQPYCQPDLLLVQGEEQLHVVLNDSLAPHVLVNRDYAQALGESLDQEAARYVARQIRRADWVAQAVRGRGTTLLQVGRLIAKHQEAFFRRGPQYLRPLTLEELARELGLHPSTVSRAIRGKYLQTDRGAYPLKDFFASSMETQAGEQVGGAAIRERVREAIQGEDPQKPYSDQELARLLGEQGFPLARRTVAKYREQLAIPVAAARKK